MKTEFFISFKHKTSQVAHALSSAPQSSSASHSAVGTLGFKRQELNQSQSDEVQEIYARFFENDAESVTTVYGNDVASKFRVAYAQFSMTGEQLTTVQGLEKALQYVEKNIDPERLYFTIKSSPDDDIVLTHRQKGGLCSLIVRDDGSVSFARIYPHPYPREMNSLRIFEVDEVDCEALAFDFLAAR